MTTTTQSKNSESVFQSNVAEIMTKSVQSIRSDDSVASALKLMIEGINSLPVVAETGKCIGILSRADLSEFLFEEDQYLARFVDADGASSGSLGKALDTCNEKLVRELMTDVVTVATERTSIQEACEIMAHCKIHHLPVANGQGQLVGIVSSLDVIGWFADKR